MKYCPSKVQEKKERNRQNNGFWDHNLFFSGVTLYVVEAQKTPKIITMHMAKVPIQIKNFTLQEMDNIFGGNRRYLNENQMI